MEDVGLQQEVKCLEAVFLLQSRNWRFNGFTIYKAVRTYRHPDQRIARLDGRKFDLLILFRQSDLPKALVLVLQVKSTHKSYKRFKNSPNRKNIKCILIRPAEPLKAVMKDLNMIFEEVLAIDHRHNKFLRPKLLKLFNQ